MFAALIFCTGFVTNDSTEIVAERFVIQWLCDKPGKELQLQFEGIEASRVEAWRKGKVYEVEFGSGKWQVQNVDSPDWMVIRAEFPTTKRLKWRTKPDWNCW